MPGLGDPAFWGRWIHIDWNESCAGERATLDGEYMLWGIEVVREDVGALLPKPAAPSVPADRPKDVNDWILDEIERMAKAGVIWDGATKKDLAPVLAGRMKDAVAAGKVKYALAPRTIQNKLSELELWPPRK
jgi:hypothetical protein